jgi:flagellar basal-body rod protein FlgB
LAGSLPTGVASVAKQRPTVRALDGNAVALDEQLTKVADTETTQSLVTSIWRKYVGMFNTALGKSG